MKSNFQLNTIFVDEIGEKSKLKKKKRKMSQLD
jgi:hypothetical protein